MDACTGKDYGCRLVIYLLTLYLVLEFVNRADFNNFPVFQGGDQHVGTRGPPPESKYDFNFSPTSPVQLATPPHSITLDEHYYPTFDDNALKKKSINRRSSRNVVLSGLCNENGEACTK